MLCISKTAAIAGEDDLFARLKTFNAVCRQFFDLGYQFLVRKQCLLDGN